MSALDQIKGNKAVILAVLAAVVVIVAYLFIGQPGRENVPEEVISKRVRLEVVEEPVAGQTDEQTASEPQGAIGVPEPDAAIAEKPEAITDRPVAVKDAHKTQAAPKSVTTADHTLERPSAAKPKAAKDDSREPASEPRAISEKRAVEKKPAKPAIKEKAVATDSAREEAEPQEAVKKQPKKAPKASKSITSKDIAARPWVVGLASFKTLGEAQEVTGSLKALHHNAYITETVKDGRKWYRVRVGFYATRQEAQKVGSSLSARFGLKNLWVVKPSKAEAKAHFK